MQRRHFIRYLGAMGLIAGIDPLVLTGCRKEDTLLKHSFKGSVLIIGAGAAGLYAAYVLKRLGIPCTVLEASGRIGFFKKGGEEKLWPALLARMEQSTR
jgi:ribulose 1,5-bisphosphate synthetase/thiazole synthase